MREEKIEKNKWLDAITRMIVLTQQGKLRWTLESLVPRPEDVTSPVFYTDFKNKIMRLYKTQVNSARVVSGLFPEVPAWRERIILEFVTNEGASLWEFPEVSPLSDLFNAVQYQAAGVTEFLDEIFAEAE
jgi:hypothetical protein